jgi:hypothetical protein
MTETTNPTTNEVVTPPTVVKKNKNYYETDDEYLLHVKVAINNSNHAEIAPVLTTYGYSVTAINEGKALYEIAMALQKLQIKEYGEQYTATEKLTQAITDASGEYKKHVSIANVAFRNQKGLLSEIAALGERKKTQAAWITQANTFYKNLMTKPDYITAMTQYGQTAALLTAAANKFKDVADLYDARQTEAGEAQTATKARDNAIADLDVWYNDYSDIAVIALNEKPELLEILGLK